MNNELQIDALLPVDMAAKAETLGVKKANLDWVNMTALSVLAGAFIALGAIFATTVSAGAFASSLSDGVSVSTAWPTGAPRLLSGLAFSLGLILVIVGGAELFTGNNLIVMAWANGKVSTKRLGSNWLVVYLGNFVGAVATALIMLISRQYEFSHGQIGLQALTIANAKSGLDFWQAIALGIMCNALVCLAVWLTYSARSTTDKIMAIVPPITAFVAAGFEHSVANMYFIPMGMLIKATAAPEFWASINRTPADFANLTLSNFLVRNLIPVTIGNIIGGAVMVGAVYWFIYLRARR
ncbi:MAG: formate transporter FocA [Anaerolineales bacterium]|nr:formate transporter FocA [Anaerolineales bacterium]